VTFTSSKSFLGPKALVTSWTEIMTGADVPQVGGFREGIGVMKTPWPS
jgi:hypothetical protein